MRRRLDFSLMSMDDVAQFVENAESKPASAGRIRSMPLDGVVPRQTKANDRDYWIGSSVGFALTR
jgi:hypothetical protein